MPTTRRSTSPTATGRTPPSFFFSGIRRAAHSMGPNDTGNTPFTHACTQSAKAGSKSPDRRVRHKRSCSTLGRRPEGPAADALGNDLTASRTAAIQASETSGTRGAAGPTLPPSAAGDNGASGWRSRNFFWTDGSCESCTPSVSKVCMALDGAPSPTSRRSRRQVASVTAAGDV